MLNKNILFLIVSIILGFVISYYYNKKINESFLMIFILVSLIFYIIFSLLGYEKEKEYFENYIVRDYLEDFNIQEEERSIKNKMIFNKRIDKKPVDKKTVDKKTVDKKPIEKKNVEKKQVDKKTGKGETKKESEQVKKIDDNQKSIQIPQESLGKGPININISYNAQNSVNKIDTNDTDNKTDKNSLTSRNLGSYPGSRIYDNSDWLYGSNAWTNDPDYYIPGDYLKNSFNKIPQQLNELKNANKYRKNQNNVCPLQVNVPWTEYKSGDSEPEPFNL
jgi:Ca2+/Na+ antiporter